MGSRKRRPAIFRRGEGGEEWAQLVERLAVLAEGLRVRHHGAAGVEMGAALPHERRADHDREVGAAPKTSR